MPQWNAVVDGEVLLVEPNASSDSPPAAGAT